jgi:hypothetical protein
MGVAVDSTKHSSRGLEHQTKSGSWNVQLLHRRAVDAVLEEQQRQDELQITDHLAIARAYERETTRVREAALDRGLQDAVDAREKPLKEVSNHRRSVKPPKKVMRKKSLTPRSKKLEGPKETDSSTCFREETRSLSFCSDDVQEDSKPVKKALSKKRFLKKLRARWKEIGCSNSESRFSDATYTTAGAYDEF